MSSPITVLTVFLGLLTFAKCQLSLEIDCTDTIYFSRESFQIFMDCLCDDDKKKCSAKTEQKYNSSTHVYNVTNTVNADGTFFPSRYSHSYSCYWKKYNEPSEIICSRLENREVHELEISDNICQALHINRPRSSCSLEDVYIIWKAFQTITKIYPVTNMEDCGLCASTKTSTTKVSTASTTTKNTQTLTAFTTHSSEGQKGRDSSNDNIPLIVGVVMAVIFVLVVFGIIIVIWWHRKRNSKTPATSHHCTSSTGTISQNYENTDEIHGYVNGNVASVPNTYVTTDNHSMETQRPALQGGQAVVDSYVSAEEVIQKKRAAAAKNSDTGNQGTEYSSIDQDMPDTVISPVNGPHNNDNTSAPNPASATPASTAYSRLGEPVRNIKNPYDALQNPDEYSVAKSTPANSNTSAQYSFAGQAPSPSSTQDSQTVHSSSPSGQPTNRNAYGYEEVGVNNMTTPVVSNDYEESPTYASGDNKDGAEASKEPDYTNFPVNEHVAAKHDYAKLGEPVRNIQNPYDVIVNQEKDGPEESTSQAPPNSADDPYSLACPT